MRETKFKYFFKDTQGKFYTQVFTLGEIEDGRHEAFMLRTDMYGSIKIVARCQWTMVTDKNGIEIYEGDILYRKLRISMSVKSREWIMEVIFKDGCFVASGSVKDDNVIVGEDIVDLKYSKTWKIIGNTIEHPSLLEGEGK